MLLATDENGAVVRDDDTGYYKENAKVLSKNKTDVLSVTPEKRIMIIIIHILIIGIITTIV
ncbi:MAG: hypothetical protein EGQ63_05945 [Clostridiales bacterium]|nr:hypothetical protein [Clostridiales bacterium]